MVCKNTEGKLDVDISFGGWIYYLEVENEWRYLWWVCF